MGVKAIMCDTREGPSDEGWWDTKGLGIDSMNVMLTQLACSKPGRFDGAATQ